MKDNEVEAIKEYMEGFNKRLKKEFKKFSTADEIHCFYLGVEFGINEKNIMKKLIDEKFGEE